MRYGSVSSTGSGNILDIKDVTLYNSRQMLALLKKQQYISSSLSKLSILNFHDHVFHAVEVYLVELVSS